MPRDLWFFLGAIWREWRTLLTGGTIIALLALWAFFGKNAPAQSLNWLVLAATLITAVFLAWRAEWLKAGGSFVEMDLKRIAQTCEGRMGPQVRGVLHYYLGKRLKISGKLADVSELSGYRLIIYLRVEGGFVDVFVPFWNREFKGARHFPKDSSLTVTGQIYDVSYEFGKVEVSLCCCALLAIDFLEVPSTLI